MTATPEKFWSRVDIGDVDSCWEWTGSRTRDPYGNPSYGHLSYQRRMIVAHRLAWELTNGPIPDGMKVLHKCDNPPCCNPAHLFLGTQQDNMIDRRDKGRHRKYPTRNPANGRWLTDKGA